jgi:transglutaminase-like putative cysteine protease
MALLLLSSCKMGKVLNSVEIKEIQLQHVQPTSPSNVSWDPFGSGLGDVQVRIKNTSTGQTLYSSEVYDDASSKNTYRFNRNVPVLIPDLKAPHRIDVYDYDDLSSDEWMGGFELQLLDYKKDSQIVLTNSNSPMEITLQLDWNYVKKRSLKNKN